MNAFKAGLPATEVKRSKSFISSESSASYFGIKTQLQGSRDAICASEPLAAIN